MRTRYILFIIQEALPRMSAPLPAKATLSGILLLSASFLLLLSTTAQAQPLQAHFDNVLGTSLDISIHHGDGAAAEAAMLAALEEIRRLESILSNWQDNSEIGRLNRTQHINDAAPELIAVLQLCEDWHGRSDAALSCRLGRMIGEWQDAEAVQELPLRSGLLQTARAANQGSIRIDGSAISIDDSIVLDVGGIAKGYIIDRALAVMQTILPDAAAIRIDIGGDAVYHGSPPGSEGWQVAVADPLAPADNAGFITRLSLNSMAVASSGHHSRSRTIRNRSFSHILSPQTGWPIISGVSAVVVAADAATADAVATALAVKNLNDGIDWVNSLDGVEALLLDAAGRQLPSNGWRRYLSEDLQQQGDASISMDIRYTLPEFDSGGYYRPYVAIWVSDAEQRVIKNLLLLGLDEQWARTNTRWWRRSGRAGTPDSFNVTRPTRGPGEYQLHWDGIDDHGVALTGGHYILHLEASRENAGVSYQSIPFSLEPGEQLFTTEGEGELGPTRVQLRMNLPD